jgi:hypothetical protein
MYMVPVYTNAVFAPLNRRAELEWQLVATLDGALSLAMPVSRAMLQRGVERTLVTSLPLYDQVPSRQWYQNFVDACAAHPGGITALAAAVDRLEPGSRTARIVAGLAGEWAGQAGGAAAGPGPGPGPGAGAVSPAPTGEEPLSNREIAALAAGFSTAVALRHLLLDAGLPAARHPRVQELTPEQAWREVNVLIGNGALRDGRRRVLACAADVYPANLVFATAGS